MSGALTPSISAVIEEDLCIACGACIPACPKANIAPAFSRKRGAHEVRIRSLSVCEACPAPCDRVCPSVEVDFLKQKRALDSAWNLTAAPSRDGWMRSVYLGWSRRYQTDPSSSSGGVVRELIAQALGNGDPVVCLARDRARRRLQPRLLLAESELESVPGSIYHSVSFAGAIDLLRQAPRPAVLVALPCQLSGILQYIAECEPDLGTRIKLIVGIVCGWMYSYHALQAFCTFNGIREPVLEETTYRGGSDRVGKLRIRTESDRFAFERANIAGFADAIYYQSCFSRDFNRLRCRVCEDHVNLCADVIAGDAWLKRKNTEKMSVIGCRTAQGEDAVMYLERRGLIALESSDFGDIVESQSRRLVFGDDARHMNQVLRARGYLMPIFRFSDAQTLVVSTFGKRWRVRWELARRAVARREAYSLYRIISVVRRPRWMAAYLVRRVRALKRVVRS